MGEGKGGITRDMVLPHSPSKLRNFSRSRSELDLAGRQAMRSLEGRDDAPIDEYADPLSEKHHAMVDRIRSHLNLTTLKYQNLSDMIEAIGLPKEKVCTYCWDGVG